MQCWKNYQLALKSEYEAYREACKFSFNIYDYTEKFDLELVEKFGWYRASNRGHNPLGVVRDHMFSIKEGFIQKIDPSLIRHPANCKLIQQLQNAKKRAKCSITIEQLQERIRKF